MAVLKAQSIGRFLASPDKSRWAVLAHGPDLGGVFETGRAFIKALSAQSPETVELTGDILREDPGRLADEIGAISMFSACRLIVVDDITEAHAAVLIDALSLEPSGTWLLIRAGRLDRKKKLLRAYEKAANAAVIACYEDGPGDLAGHVRGALREQGIDISGDALMALIGHLGGDRALAMREVEKLAIYCYGAESVALEDVLAICGDSLTLSADSVVDEIAAGHTGNALRDAGRLASAEGWGRLLPSLNGHFARLQSLRIEVDRGRSATQVIDQVRPPVFFKRKPALQRQLAIWRAGDISSALVTIADAVLMTRNHPELEPEIVERAVMSLSRKAEILGRSVG